MKHWLYTICGYENLVNKTLENLPVSIECPPLHFVELGVLADQRNHSFLDPYVRKKYIKVLVPDHHSGPE
jgi:hypothetical protein